jgi:hypothetical protein
MWQWMFGGETTQTPHEFNYDYNYSYDYDVVSDCPAANCTCS